MLIEAADASQGEEASVWGTGVPAGLKPGQPPLGSQVKNAMNITTLP